MNICKDIILVLVLLFHISGCVVYYHDIETGADHIWGIGHLATKVSEPDNGKQAVIRKATLAGIALGIEEESLGMSVGWNQRERIVIYDENTSISIQKPDSDNSSFLFKFGSEPPISPALSNKILNRITP